MLQLAACLHHCELVDSFYDLHMALRTKSTIKLLDDSISDNTPDADQANFARLSDIKAVFRAVANVQRRFVKRAQEAVQWHYFVEGLRSDAHEQCATYKLRTGLCLVQPGQLSTPNSFRVHCTCACVHAV